MFAANARNEFVVEYEPFLFTKPHCDSNVTVRANWNVDFTDASVWGHENGPRFWHFGIKSVLFSVGMVSNLLRFIGSQASIRSWLNIQLR